MSHMIFNYHVIGEDFPRQYTYATLGWTGVPEHAMYYTGRQEVLHIFSDRDESKVHGVLMRNGEVNPLAFKDGTMTVVDGERVYSYKIVCETIQDIGAQIKEYRMGAMVNDAIDNLRKAMDIRLDYEVQKALDEQKRPYSLNEYMEDAMRTKNPLLARNGLLTDGGLGIAGEAGEVADMIKKHLFQGHKLDQAALMSELGDVLWYIAEIADASGFTLEDVARWNVEKLKERYPDGFSEEASVNRKE